MKSNKRLASVLLAVVGLCVQSIAAEQTTFKIVSAVKQADNRNYIIVQGFFQSGSSGDAVTITLAEPTSVELISGKSVLNAPEKISQEFRFDVNKRIWAFSNGHPRATALLPYLRLYVPLKELPSKQELRWLGEAKSTSNELPGSLIAVSRQVTIVRESKFSCWIYVKNGGRDHALWISGTGDIDPIVARLAWLDGEPLERSIRTTISDESQQQFLAVMVMFLTATNTHEASK